MPDFTDELTRPCEISAIFAVDVLTARSLQTQHVPLDTSLDECGCDDRECEILNSWIGMYRAAKKTPPLSPNQIVEPETTLRQLIDFVC